MKKAIFTFLTICLVATSTFAVEISSRFTGCTAHLTVVVVNQDGDVIRTLLIHNYHGGGCAQTLEGARQVAAQELAN